MTDDQPTTTTRTRGMQEWVKQVAPYVADVSYDHRPSADNPQGHADRPRTGCVNCLIGGAVGEGVEG